ncbi:MAG: hypothetical protein ACRD3W_03030 [Terriglobales bacterium]
MLQQTSTTGLSIVFGPVGRNFLPPTRLDSFVTEAKENAELIYGDEGTDGPPPYFEFTKEHRIGRGITGARSTGLTTGLGSYLPDAWGCDEWVKGPEFDTSSSGRSAYATTQLLLQDLMMPPPPQGPVPDILPALPQNVTGALSGF